MKINEIFVNADNLPKSLSREETKELFIKMKNGDKEAKEKLATHNIRIVLYEVVKKFRYTRYDQKELVSVGNVGLMKAINSYDLSKNINFFTYAKKCIDNEIILFLRDDKKNLYNYKLEDTLDATDEDNLVTLGDILSTTETVEDEFENKEVRRITREIVEKFPSPRERIIIMLRYGFYDDKIYKQEEISKLFSMSQTNVFKIIDVTLDEISNELYKQDILVKPRNKSKYKYKCSSERYAKVKTKGN